MSPEASSSSVGIVVIGRNEGTRLPRCLDSVKSPDVPVIYVDSGSTDDSVSLAQRSGVNVLELRSDRPFSAARARNEGLEKLRADHPALLFVQYIDGDCELAIGWIGRALSAMEHDSRRGIVIGHLREQNVDASLYNRLCSLEWRSPPGDLTNFGALGGIMFVRISAFDRAGAFNVDVIAGEDSEFGVRVGIAGFKVTKIDAPMASHDADITRFDQWWKRAVRGGHAIGQRSYLNGRGPSRDCMRERRSAIFWGLSLPLIVLGLAIPTYGLSLLLLASYGFLASRVFRYRRRWGDSVAEARLYARFNVIGKLAEAVGLIRFFWNHAIGRFRIIEYK